jgi:hypothetical protein
MVLSAVPLTSCVLWEITAPSILTDNGGWGRCGLYPQGPRTMKKVAGRAWLHAGSLLTYSSKEFLFSVISNYALLEVTYEEVKLSP